MIKVDPPVVAWQTLNDFPKYEMTIHGDVRNIDSGIRVQAVSYDGIAYVELMRDGKPYLQHVNRLRWNTFPLSGLPSPEVEVA